MLTVDLDQRIGPWRGTLTLVGLLLVSTAPITSGVVAAQEDLSLDIEVPGEATAGEEITTSATVTVPDLVGSYEEELRLTLYVDGEEIASKTLVVEDGTTSSVSFDHAFESEGTHSVEVEAEITVAGQTFSDSVSRTVDVSDVGTAAPTITGPSVTELTTEGASFVLPESISDEVNSYRDRSPIQLGSHAFVLASNDDLFIVFSEEEPQAGLASVEGTVPGESISSRGQTFEILVAASVSFSTKGSSATVSEITADPQAHRLDLVRVQATHRQVATLTDPDQGNDPTIPSTSGILIEEPESYSVAFAQPGKQAGSLLVNTSTDKLGSNGKSELSPLFATRQPHISTFGFGESFWTDTEMTVDGIVLTPGSSALEFISAFDEAGMVRASSGEPLLYVVDKSLGSQSYESISELNKEADDGEVVSVRANLIGQRMSVQETMEHTTPCGADIAQVPAPSGPICVDLLHDTHIHIGAAWTAVPETEDDVILVVGLSSRELDSPAEPIRGDYRLVGEVASASRFDDSLPERRILILYDVKRLADINYREASGEGQATIESGFERLETVLSAQVESSTVRGTDSAETSGQSASTSDQHESGGRDDESITNRGGEIVSDIANAISGIGDAISGFSDGLSDLFG